MNNNRNGMAIYAAAYENSKKAKMLAKRFIRHSTKQTNSEVATSCHDAHTAYEIWGRHRGHPLVDMTHFHRAMEEIYPTVQWDNPGHPSYTNVKFRTGFKVRVPDRLLSLNVFGGDCRQDRSGGQDDSDGDITAGSQQARLKALRRGHDFLNSELENMLQRCEMFHRKADRLEEEVAAKAQELAAKQQQIETHQRAAKESQIAEEELAHDRNTARWVARKLYRKLQDIDAHQPEVKELLGTASHVGPWIMD